MIEELSNQLLMAQGKVIIIWGREFREDHSRSECEDLYRAACHTWQKMVAEFDRRHGKRTVSIAMKRWNINRVSCFPNGEAPVNKSPRHDVSGACYIHIHLIFQPT